ncbi:MAG: SUMF1/EgtB/PvdO family nonheme iron enzyme [Anaerolineales bacterium]|nr:SUMF1/EgtB/PvdO family nonheme iron enzyme [Anaerolineales bacterium]
MREVQSVLRGAGFAVWTDEGLEPGTPSWQAAIAEAIGQCQALVVLLSPSAKASVWVNNEVSFAQMHGKRIFPVLVAGEPTTAVPISLISVQWVDGRSGVRGAAAEGLRHALARQLGRGPVITFDWVTIPAGEFLMGSDWAKDPLTYYYETPQHKRCLREFRIAKYPVTNMQYGEFVRATSHKKPDLWTDGRIPDGKEQHPVVGVSWYDAQAFKEYQPDDHPEGNDRRTLRGGSWSSYSSVRCAVRDGNNPDYWNNVFGFRVVCLGD